ncbi:MAG: cytochrome c oxidase subunit II [Pyrinomonadaceae bacterium]
MMTNFYAFLFFQFRLFPETASREAARVDEFFYFMLAVCGAVTLLVAGLIIFFAVKYRRRAENQIALSNVSSRWLEIGWTVVPFLIFIYMFYWGATLYFRITQPPPDALEINVVAKQWMWKFQHASGQREINTLHVPVNRPVKLTLASQDVIHSFFVPAFRLHYDVVPGRYRTVWFEPTEIGNFHLFCSQYCGTQHSKMTGEIVVMSAQDYEKWLTSDAEGSPASEGQKLFRQLACNACHTGDSNARAPLLQNLYGRNVTLQTGETVRADENYIRESILNPQAKITAGYQPIMPTFQGQLDEEQLMQLIAYIKSLNAGREQIPPVSAPNAPQPSPVENAIRDSENKGQSNANLSGK